MNAADHFITWSIGLVGASIAVAVAVVSYEHARDASADSG
jgi:hypothetical protein